MKKIITPLFLTLFLVSFGLAQHKEKDNKIKALKTAFITQELQLTASEAEKFWPVYNTYEKEVHAIRKENREKIKHILKNEMQTLTEVQAKELLLKIQQQRERENQLETNLEKQLVEQIGTIRVLKLKKAEHEFKMQLLKKYRGGKK